MRTRRELLKAALGTSVTLLVAACAGGSPSATRPAPAGGAPTAGATAGWEQVIAAAKQEGKLVVMSAPGADVRDALTQGFQSKYPEIELDFTGLRGGEAATKLFNERQAGQYRVDLLVHGTTTIVTDLMPEGAVDPVQPFLVGPDVQDASKWLGGRLDFADDDGKYDLVFITAVKSPMAYHPRLVSAGEIEPYRDLLDPKWRGKVSMLDPRTADAGQATVTFLYTTPSLGTAYLEQLFASGIVFSKDERQIVDWVGRGQYPVALAPSEFLVVELKKKGVPVESANAETLREASYLTAAWGTVAVINRAPHPNATKVYLNWLLSQEGQTAASKAAGYPSRRLDVPTDHLPEAVVPKPGVQY